MAVEQSFIPDDATEADAGFQSMRAEPRDSMFLMAVMRRPGGPDVSVKVRNLSAGGMMAESPIGFSRGEAVETDLRGIGTITGKVAWTAGGRVGVQFDGPIDPRLARALGTRNRRQRFGRRRRADVPRRRGHRRFFSGGASARARAAVRGARLRDRAALLRASNNRARR